MSVPTQLQIAIELVAAEWTLSLPRSATLAKDTVSAGISSGQNCLIAPGDTARTVELPVKIIPEKP